jgi:hypothetical protein
MNTMKKRTASSVVAASLFACLAATPVYAAKLISAEDPDVILAMANAHGSASLTTDSEGDPKIVGTIDGTRYSILFYGCSNGTDCDDIQFTAAWGGYRVPMRDINAWNRDMRYGKAYLDDENDPVLEMTVNIDYGVSKRNLDDTFNWWSVALDGFKSNVLKD